MAKVMRQAAGSYWQLAGSSPVACRQVACSLPAAGCWLRLPGHLPPRSGAVAATKEGCIDLTAELPTEVMVEKLSEAVSFAPTLGLLFAGERAASYARAP